MSLIHPGLFDPRYTCWTNVPLGAENEMLKTDCVSCTSATGLLQSKHNNECYVPILGLAVLSTLDGSVKVEHILTFLQKRKLLDGNLKTFFFTA